MVYFRLLENDDDGMTREEANALLARIYQRHQGEGRREVLDDPVPPSGMNTYFLYLENVEQAQMCRTVLSRRNIRFEEHPHLPQPEWPADAAPQLSVPDDSTVGVIFFLVSMNELDTNTAIGMVRAIAVTLHELNPDRMVLHAGFRKDRDQPAFYWVCLNFLEAGAIFLHALRERGVEAVHYPTLKGERPSLNPVNLNQAAQFSEVVSRKVSRRKKRQQARDAEESPLEVTGEAALAQGQGFAAVIGTLRNNRLARAAAARFAGRKREKRPSDRARAAERKFAERDPSIIHRERD